MKTPYELGVMEQSAAISSDAHMAGMRTARPGRFEYEVEAAIEHTYLSRGAMSWGYPSIVGSGPNATVLHYDASSRKMQDGDLLLVDAAGNFQGYTVDITRTYPVNGRFTELAEGHLPHRAGCAGSRHARRPRWATRRHDIVKATVDVAKEGLAEARPHHRRLR